MSSSAGIADLPKVPSPVVIPKSEDYIPQVEQQLNPVQNIIFKLVNKSKGDVYLPLYAQNIVKGKDKDGNQILDTLRVLKGVYTIWESEQQNIKLDAKTLSKNRRSLKFEFSGKDNIALVKADDKIMLDALRILPHNIEVIGHNKGSRFAFFEVDTNKQAEIDAVKRQLRRKAVKAAEEQNTDALKKHAVYLRIRVLDDYGYPKVEKALRNEYEDYADMQPERFLASIGSKEVEIAYLIGKAISDAKIDTSTNKGSAYWATGGFICKIPSTAKAFDYLVEFAMLPHEESKTFKKQLENISP